MAFFILLFFNSFYTKKKRKSIELFRVPFIYMAFIYFLVHKPPQTNKMINLFCIYPSLANPQIPLCSHHYTLILIFHPTKGLLHSPLTFRSIHLILLYFVPVPLSRKNELYIYLLSTNYELPRQSILYFLHYYIFKIIVVLVIKNRVKFSLL